LPSTIRRLASEYPHGNKKGYDKMGTYIGKGVNEGAIVWEGPLGGIFLYNKNGNRSQVANLDNVKFFKE